MRRTTQTNLPRPWQDWSAHRGPERWEGLFNCKTEELYPVLQSRQLPEQCWQKTSAVLFLCFYSVAIPFVPTSCMSTKLFGNCCGTPSARMSPIRPAHCLSFSSREDMGGRRMLKSGVLSLSAAGGDPACFSWTQHLNLRTLIAYLVMGWAPLCILAVWEEGTWGPEQLCLLSC